MAPEVLELEKFTATPGSGVPPWVTVATTWVDSPSPSRPEVVSTSVIAEGGAAVVAAQRA